MSNAKLEHQVPVSTGGSDGSRRLRVVHGRQNVDLPAAERAVQALLVALGRDPSSPHLADTPRRVAESFTEMLTPREFDLTTFPNDEDYDELVLAKNIPVQSLCQHHMLPFSELFARDLQVQERLTVQVADWLQEHLATKGVGVVIEAEHMCMSMRGVQARGSRTITSSVHGVLRENAASRQEFFMLARDVYAACQDRTPAAVWQANMRVRVMCRQAVASRGEL